ncbi:MAG: cyclic nucleotide-binding domain-containing protein [Candidatus Omnitrophica bacterium]|nr:cyclic nucleotide-binding domain-containing protein [Candidatus Omnitrophota bacterium]
MITEAVESKVREVLASFTPRDVDPQALSDRLVAKAGLAVEHVEGVLSDAESEGATVLMTAKGLLFSPQEILKVYQLMTPVIFKVFLRDGTAFQVAVGLESGIDSKAFEAFGKMRAVLRDFTPANVNSTALFSRLQSEAGLNVSAVTLTERVNRRKARVVFTSKGIVIHPTEIQKIYRSATAKIFQVTLTDDTSFQIVIDAAEQTLPAAVDRSDVKLAVVEKYRRQFEAANQQVASWRPDNYPSGVSQHLDSSLDLLAGMYQNGSVSKDEADVLRLCVEGHDLGYSFNFEDESFKQELLKVWRTIAEATGNGATADELANEAYNFLQAFSKTTGPQNNAVTRILGHGTVGVALMVRKLMDRKLGDAAFDEDSALGLALLFAAHHPGYPISMVQESVMPKMVPKEKHPEVLPLLDKLAPILLINERKDAPGGADPDRLRFAIADKGADLLGIPREEGRRIAGLGYALDRTTPARRETTFNIGTFQIKDGEPVGKAVWTGGEVGAKKYPIIAGITIQDPQGFTIENTFKLTLANVQQEADAAIKTMKALGDEDLVKVVKSQTDYEIGRTRAIQDAVLALIGPEGRLGKKGFSGKLKNINQDIAIALAEYHTPEYLALPPDDPARQAIEYLLGFLSTIYNSPMAMGNIQKIVNGQKDVTGMLEALQHSLVGEYFDMPEMQAIALFLGTEVRNFTEGDRIIREGDHGTEAFVVMSGKVAVKHGDKQIAELGEGSLFGEIALVGNRTRTASVVAEGPVRVLAIPGDRLLKLVRQKESFAVQIFFMIARRLEAQEQKAGAGEDESQQTKAPELVITESRGEKSDFAPKKATLKVGKRVLAFDVSEPLYRKAPTPLVFLTLEGYQDLPCMVLSISPTGDGNHPWTFTPGQERNLQLYLMVVLHLDMAESTGSQEVNSILLQRFNPPKFHLIEPLLSDSEMGVMSRGLDKLEYQLSRKALPYMSGMIAAFTAPEGLPVMQNEQFGDVRVAETHLPSAVQNLFYGEAFLKRSSAPFERQLAARDILKIVWFKDGGKTLRSAEERAKFKEFFDLAQGKEKSAGLRVGKIFEGAAPLWEIISTYPQGSLYNRRFVVAPYFGSADLRDRDTEIFAVVFESGRQKSRIYLGTDLAKVRRIFDTISQALKDRGELPASTIPDNLRGKIEQFVQAVAIFFDYAEKSVAPDLARAGSILEGERLKRLEARIRAALDRVHHKTRPETPEAEVREAYRGEIMSTIFHAVRHITHIDVIAQSNDIALPSDAEVITPGGDVRGVAVPQDPSRLIFRVDVTTNSGTEEFFVLTSLRERNDVALHNGENYPKEAVDWYYAFLKTLKPEEFASVWKQAMRKDTGAVMPAIDGRLAVLFSAWPEHRKLKQIVRNVLLSSVGKVDDISVVPPQMPGFAYNGQTEADVQAAMQRLEDGPPDYAGKTDASKSVGGIDIKNIDVARTGDGSPIRFDEAALQELVNKGFDGLTPVFLGWSENPLSALGIK